MTRIFVLALFLVAGARASAMPHADLNCKSQDGVYAFSFAIGGYSLDPYPGDKNEFDLSLRGKTVKAVLKQYWNDGKSLNLKIALPSDEAHPRILTIMSTKIEGRASEFAGKAVELRYRDVAGPAKRLRKAVIRCEILV